MTSFSLEYFPPNVEADKTDLLEQAELMSFYEPIYMSITHSFNALDRNNTLDIAQRLSSRINTSVVPHITCAKSSKETMISMANDYSNIGISSVVALRGDANSEEYSQLNRYIDAKEFTQALSDQFAFKIFTAGYPEGHPESISQEADILYLKEKCIAGADEIITQWFFNNEDFLKYRDNVNAFGIDKPIAAGILPISDFEKVKKFAKVCGAKIPQSLEKRFASVRENDDQGIEELGQSIAIDQIENLKKEGVDNFHLYTLNRKQLTQDIIHHFKKPINPQTNRNNEGLLKNNRKAS
jgi:methylenetetrahydrofolate reductase (NADPH)